MGVLVERSGGDRWRVRISGDGPPTHHEVTVPKAFPATVGCAEADPTWLVRASVEFLLEREPPTAILRAFGLDQIERYFPDYPAEIRARCAGAPEQSEGSSTTERGGR